MEEQMQSPLQVLGELAREYHQKYLKLQEFVKNAPPDTLVHQIKVRGELSTDRFRAAQQALLAQLTPVADSDGREAFEAALTLSRCFDEMRVLFQVLLELSCKSEG